MRAWMGVRRIAFGLSCRLLAASLLAAVHPEAQAESYGRKVQKEVQASWVITVAEGGDLQLFGAAVTIPARRPSSEFCGEWLTSTPAERARNLDAKVRVASKSFATLSAADRDAIRRKAIEPMKQCEADFKRHCARARRVGRATRTHALVEARKALAELADVAARRAAEGYLGRVLQQCPLDR